MKLLDEHKSEKYYLKVGDLYVCGVEYETIHLTPRQSNASEYLKGHYKFKDSYRYAVRFAKEHNLGKVKVVKHVRVVREEEHEVDQLTLDVLNAYVEEMQN